MSDSPRGAVRICIVSPRNLANELLAHALEGEVRAACRIVSSLDELSEWLKPVPVDSAAPPQSGGLTIVLVDCVEQDFNEVMAEIAKRNSQPDDDSIMAIYNVYPGWGIEEEALRAGVKGFFYKQDSLKLLSKGINAILRKEVWISREILMRSALGSLRKKQSKMQEETGLSLREIESLRLLAGGASNDEIAQKLFISPNTVKTHVYNIYRKIKVTNRVEAAAWASKNL